MERRWIEKLVATRQQRSEQRAIEAQFTMLAQRYAGILFKKLAEELQSAARSFSELTDSSIQTSFNGTLVEIHRDRFPAFRIRVQFADGLIQVSRTIRASSSAKNKTEEFSVLVTARGQDQVYYVMEGEEIAFEGEVAERILLPAFETL